jgi:hypothetical protein
MKKIFAVALSALALGTVSAATITIDAFDGSQGPLSAGLSGNPNPMCDNNGVREVCETSVSNPLNLRHFVEVHDGFLEVQNGGTSDTDVRLRWNIGAGTIPAGTVSGVFNFVVLFSDGNPTNLAFTFNGAALTSSVIAPNTTNATVSFNAPIAALSAGGVLELTISGAAGWDLGLDSLGLTTVDAPAVPAPGIALLLGLGLAGIAVSRRRA